MNTSVNQKVLATTQMLTTEIDWNEHPTAETQYKKIRSTTVITTSPAGWVAVMITWK